MPLTQKQAEARARARWGPSARLEWREWHLRTSDARVELCYAWRGEVIVAVGRSFEDLLASEVPAGQPKGGSCTRS